MSAYFVLFFSVIVFVARAIATSSSSGGIFSENCIKSVAEILINPSTLAFVIPVFP